MSVDGGVCTVLGSPSAQTSRVLVLSRSSEEFAPVISDLRSGWPCVQEPPPLLDETKKSIQTLAYVLSDTSGGGVRKDK